MRSDVLHRRGTITRKPVPMTPTVAASSRAMYRVASPEAAPVRICPNRPASKQASNAPDSKSYSITIILLPPAPPKEG